MIGIVTVLYNSELVLEDFFRTLNEQNYKDFVLYLVDNNSTDKSVKVGKKYASNVNFKCKWLLQNENLGVATGNNIGIKAALADDCDYILLANNDIVLKEDTIQTLFDGMHITNATMAVPKIYYWDNPKIIWMAGGGFKWLRFTTFHRGIHEEDIGQYNNPLQIEYAPTCFMLIKSSVFSRIGYMDEDYFVYYDDSDFIWRSVILGNETLFYFPKSVMWHKVSSSTGGVASDFTVYYMARNHVYFALKYCKGFHFLLFVCSQIAYFFLRFVFVCRTSKYKLAIKAYKDGWKLYIKNRNINKRHKSIIIN